MAGRWVDVGEAARELDISTDAVRKRIARGSLESSREDGTVLVWLDVGGTEAGREAQVDRGALIDSLQDQVAYLRDVVATRDEEIRRRDVIISQLTARIPEIEAPPAKEEEPTSTDATSTDAAEAPPEAREYAVTPTPQPGRVGPQAPLEEAQEPSERPWWRRVFGG